MKKTMKNIAQAVAAIGLASLSVTDASAAVYSADLSAGSPGNQILFVNTAETTPSPVGSTMWFIADTLNGGMPSGSVPVSLINSIQSGSSGLQLIGTGATPGNYPAVIGQGIASFTVANIPTTAANQNVYAVLWNDANHDNIIGDAGDTFGTFKIGIVAPPALGNASWNVTGKMHADQNLVVVPEPAAMGTVVGLACLAGALARRKMRK